MFSDREKLIFRYEVLGEVKYADPMAVRRALLRESAGQFFHWWGSAAQEPSEKPTPPPKDKVRTNPADPPTPEEAEYVRLVAQLMTSLDADERCVPVIRAAFGLAPFDPKTGDGVPEEECWRVLIEYQRWREKNARAGGDSQTTSPPDTPPEAPPGK